MEIKRLKQVTTKIFNALFLILIAIFWKADLELHKTIWLTFKKLQNWNLLLKKSEKILVLLEACKLIKQDSLAQVYACKFCKNFQNTNLNENENKNENEEGVCRLYVGSIWRDVYRAWADIWGGELCNNS